MNDGMSCSEYISYWAIPLMVIAIVLGILYWGASGGFVLSSTNGAIITLLGVFVIILYWLRKLRSRR